jgi:hypothetical protein
MEEIKRNSGQNLGIAALITAIIAFIVAVIPCVGLVAIVPGIIAIVLAAVGLSQAARDDSPRGIPLAGLIIAIVAFLISFSQGFAIGKIARNSDKWPNEIHEIINDVQENVVKEIEDANVSIKVESDDEKVEINVGQDKNKSDKEQTLEDLEKAKANANDTIKPKK